MTELGPPRGTADLLSDRADAMLALYEEAHRLARLFGYRYLETPTFEHTELFARTSGQTSDVVTKEMYTFEDKGGRSVTLRPEGTAPVMRAYLERAQQLPNPFKGYYVQTYFRHARPQLGRTREFRQFGVEVIGDEGPGSDAEVIVVGDRYLRGRGLRDLTLKLNSIGDEVCRPEYRTRLIDYLTPFEDQLDEDCRTRLRTNPMRVMDCKVDGGKDFVLAAPTIVDHLCDPCAAHFAQVRAALDREGVAFELAPRLVRGLDYYMRTAFEFESAVLADAGATLCGGGRYDGLAEILGGQHAPGIGFGLGLERVLLAMEREGVVFPAPNGPRCFVVTVVESARDAGARLVDELRDAGIPTASSFGDRPLKAQLKMADRAGATFAAILGERELADETVTFRRLVDGVQTGVPTDEAVRWLAGPLDDAGAEGA